LRNSDVEVCGRHRPDVGLAVEREGRRSGDVAQLGVLGDPRLKGVKRGVVGDAGHRLLVRKAAGPACLQK
jgi:hypothetical protein